MCPNIFTVSFSPLLWIFGLPLSLQVMRLNHGDEYVVAEFDPINWTFDKCPQVSGAWVWGKLPVSLWTRSFFLSFFRSLTSIDSLARPLLFYWTVYVPILFWRPNMHLMDQLAANVWGYFPSHLNWYTITLCEEPTVKICKLNNSWEMY